MVNFYLLIENYLELYGLEHFNTIYAQNGCKFLFTNLPKNIIVF